MSERMDPIELRKVVDMKLRSDRFKFIEAARTEWQMDLDAAEDAIEKYEDLDALGE